MGVGRALARAAAGWLAAACLAAPGAAQVAGIVSGPAASTELRMAEDLVAEGAACGVALGAIATAGSLEAATAVRSRSGVQLGFVQEDVLEYARTLAPDDAELRRIAQGLRVVLPLHAEEIHVLARGEVAGLADLAGRRVSVGVEGSGTLLTAGLVLDLTEIEPAERVEDLAPAEALEALIRGEIDAMFLVGGAPAPLLGDPRLDPAAFRLLPLTDPVLTAVYRPARIAAGAYPVAAAGVEVVAVRSVLMAYEFSATGNAYHRASCAAVADAAQVALARLDRLQAEGHPKWRDLDPTDLPAGWEISDCALSGLAPGRALVCDGAQVPAPAAQPEAGGAGPEALFRQRVCARVGC